MRIVLDTNILLVSIPKRSQYRCIFDALLEKRFALLISHDILTEYEEIVGSKTTPQIAINIVEMLLSLSNVEKIDIFFKWNLIEADPDDNKFTDCAIAGNADYLVTNDHHFDVLNNLDFPKLNRLMIDELVELLPHSSRSESQIERR